MHISSKEYRELCRRLAPKPNKYRARKIEHNGLTFDSKAEYMRYRQLLAMQAAGEIQHLRYHALTFRLGTSDTGKPIRYTPDFTYQTTSGLLIAEEVKGYRVRDWPLRAALFHKCFPEWELRVIQA